MCSAWNQPEAKVNWTTCRTSSGYGVDIRCVFPEAMLATQSPRSFSLHLFQAQSTWWREWHPILDKSWQATCAGGSMKKKSLKRIETDFLHKFPNIFHLQILDISWSIWSWTGIAAGDGNCSAMVGTSQNDGFQTNPWFEWLTKSIVLLAMWVAVISLIIVIILPDQLGIQLLTNHALAIYERFYNTIHYWPSLTITTNHHSPSWTIFHHQQPSFAHHWPSFVIYNHL